MKIECDDCGKMMGLEETGHSANGVNLCSECLATSWGYCDECGALIHQEEAYTRNGEEEPGVYVCQNCLMGK